MDERTIVTVGDGLTLTDLAQEYFARIDAPHKEMALIEDASHFAAFTQPERFREELVNRVLPVIQSRSGGTTAKADPDPAVGADDRDGQP